MSHFFHTESKFNYQVSNTKVCLNIWKIYLAGKFPIIKSTLHEFDVNLHSFKH